MQGNPRLESKKVIWAGRGESLTTRCAGLNPSELHGNRRPQKLNLQFVYEVLT